jgi:hypothetical protein
VPSVSHRGRRAARRSALAVLLAAAAPLAAAAQQPAAAPEVRVFLDCPDGGCDSDYIQTETPWVSFVRDRTAADVHVLVTRLETAAGGSEYTMALVGRERFAAMGDTLRFVSRPGQASDLVRQGFTRTLQLGLVPFAARTATGARLRVTAEEAPVGQAAAAAAGDPWNAWVFEVQLGGSFDREDRQRELSLESGLDARRITEGWKFGVEADADVEREHFELDDRTVTSRAESYSGGAVLVRSLGANWGTGMEASAGSSTFQNTELLVRVAPAVEYSVWPYAEATRRQLTLQYSLGVSSFAYREETIFDRLSETRPTQAFVVGFDVQQPWGSAEADFEAASFLDDLEQYRLEADANLDLRLMRGLALSIGGSASLIRDQISIVKRDATPEEILLQRRALLTDYRYSAYVGVSYTFGSIFRSVVNPRFGTGPGSILR